ncbi:MAG: alpha-2-macroglobulin family protein, partial [Solirubrobacteraceae bacterium]
MRPMRLTMGTLLAAGALLAACKSKRAAPEAEATRAPEKTRAAGGGGPGATSTNEVMDRAPAPAAPAAAAEEKSQVPKKVSEAQGVITVTGSTLMVDKAKAPEAPTRAWFPETFLFEPLVVTDDHGAAVVPVRVPDRLTTWRVLALAHSRSGAQGGAVTSFLGTLPTYVDPVVPPFLIQGDEVRVPIQIVNTTAGEVASALEVSVAGATLRGGTGGARRIPAQGSALDHATLVADRAGRVKLRVALAGSDAVERTFDVRPSGRPVTELRSGTLAAPRSFSTAGSPGAD